MPKLSKMFTVKEINKIRDDLILKHGNNCAICKRPRTEFKNNLSVDHNHKTGKIRGLLCFYCNKRQVGRHTIETACKILDYLVRFDVPVNEEK